MSGHSGRYRLTIEGLDEEAYLADRAQFSGASGYSPEVRALAPTADDRAAGVRRFETTVDGWVFVVAAEDEARALLREKAGEGAGQAGHHGTATVTAQIPGRVVRLWVADGDTVEPGQRLLAIEAMKMENEVRAPRAGTIESIRVAPDSSVELGDELLTVR